MKRALLILAVMSTPALAYNLTKATSGTAEAVVTGSADLFAAERCIVMIDLISAPIVYRTPDRPNESLIYSGRDGGNPIVFRLDRDGRGVRVSIFNGVKWRRQIAACAKAEVQ